MAIDLSKGDMNRYVNPYASPDAAYLELKSQVKNANDKSAIHLRYQDVFKIDPESFKENPELLAKIEQAMHTLEAKPYGQALFRDILLNEARVKPADIVGYKDLNTSPAAFVPSLDAILFDTDIDKNPLMQATLKSLGLDRYEVFIMHEGDHAAKIYGRTMPPELIQNQMRTNENNEKIFHQIQLRFGCDEANGMARERLYLADIGVSGRTDYSALEKQLPLFKEELIKESKQWPGGMPLEKYNDIVFGLQIRVERGAGCSDMSVEEAHQRAQIFANRILKEAGVSVALPQQDFSPTKEPMHGLNAALPPKTRQIE